jgi:CheY-like chemotaxis protein
MTEKAFVVTLGKRDENQRLLAETLRDMSYEVEITPDETALSERLSGSPSPDLSIIDIDGFDPAIWAVSERFAEHSIPVLVVASADADRVQAEASTHGINAVLSKPLDESRLTATLKSLLEN